MPIFFAFISNPKIAAITKPLSFSKCDLEEGNTLHYVSRDKVKFELKVPKVFCEDFCLDRSPLLLFPTPSNLWRRATHMNQL